MEVEASITLVHLLMHHGASCGANAKSGLQAGFIKFTKWRNDLTQLSRVPLSAPDVFYIFSVFPGGDLRPPAAAVGHGRCFIPNV